MRRNLSLYSTIFIVLLVLCVSCFDEPVEELRSFNIELQPESQYGKDAVIMYHPFNDSIKDLNFGEVQSILATAWETNDTLIVTRSLIRFNFTGIKTDAEIIDAKLSLYFNATDDTYPNHSTESGSNAFWIERIIGSWVEDSVTWNNQPETTSVNAVLVDSSDTPTHNYHHIDVTDLVADMVKNPTKAFGFELRLQSEQYYRAVVLASSDHYKIELHPKLNIAFKQMVIQ